MLISVATSLSAFADSPQDRLQLTQLVDDEHKVKIDGKLSEAIWQQLPAYDKFVVLEPDTLKPALSPTLVRVFYTQRGIYYGIDMHQPEGTLVKRLSGRDLRALNRDAISITLDTSGEGRYAYWFTVYLGDSLGDGTALPERKFSSEWDGPWRGASATTAQGWSAEFFIPWSAVAMPATGTERHMGMYMSRKVAYLDERWGWPTLPSTGSKFMSGLLPIGMRDVQPRQQYNFYPFTSVTADKIDNELRYQLGVDMFWRPSSNFQVNATINPDFGGVESDDVIINLTATETFFPEKRLFFVEGQQIFVASPRATRRGGGVGRSGNPYTMVNTRRIGGRARTPLNPNELDIERRQRLQPAQLIGAAKVTGQAGRLRYGLLGAFEKETKFDATGPGAGGIIGEDNLHSPGSNYGIARVLYEDNHRGAYRALGLLSTAVLHDEGDALVQGIDWHYLSAEGGVAIDGQTFTSDVDGSKRGYGGFIDFEFTPSQGKRYRLGLEYMDRNIDLNGLGFLARNDRYRMRGTHIRTSSSPLIGRNNQFDVRGFMEQNNNEEFLGAGIFLSNRTTFNNFSTLTARLGHFTQGIDDLNSFGNGSYKVTERSQASLDFATDTSARMSYKLGGGYDEERLGGDSFNGSLGFSWRPVDRMNVEASVKYSDRRGWLLHQGGQDFTSFSAKQWQPTLTLEYYFSARQQFRISAQWVGIKAREQDFYLIPDNAGRLLRSTKPPGPADDFAISDMVIQIRYRWELAPLSDLFIVYTRASDITRSLGEESFGDLLDTAWNTPIGNQLVVKLRYRFGS